MKEPGDLDPFAEDQIELTRHLDAGGPGKIDQLIFLAVGLMTEMDNLIIRGGLGPNEWQRACYELHERAKSDPSFSNKALAEAMWSVVQYMQQAIEASDRGMQSPEMIELMRKRDLTVTPSEEP